MQSRSSWWGSTTSIARLEHAAGSRALRASTASSHRGGLRHRSFDIADMLAGPAQLEAFEGPSTPSSATWIFPSRPCCRSCVGASAPAPPASRACSSASTSTGAPGADARSSPMPSRASPPLIPSTIRRWIRIGEAGLYFPFFLKPIKSSGHGSAFASIAPRTSTQAIEKLREDIGLIADPFNTVLDHARLPPTRSPRWTATSAWPRRSSAAGSARWRATSSTGEVVSYGIVDSLRYPQVLSFFHYRYPSGLPERMYRHR